MRGVSCTNVDEVVGRVGRVGGGGGCGGGSGGGSGRWWIMIRCVWI